MTPHKYLEVIMSEYYRQSVVDLIKSWEGLNEADGSYKKIINIYNSKQPFPRGIKMEYGWAWCACTWSALAKALNYTDIMPIEISCYYLIEEAKKMGVWVEADNYVPYPGDAVLYDWQDSGSGDNTGNPDHVGTVIEVYKDAGYFVVMEGNYKDSVKRRTISINGKYIRGFIVPKYTDNSLNKEPNLIGKDLETVAHEVIAGKWGNCEHRKMALALAGYNYSNVQAKVNQILNGSAYKPSANATPDQPTSSKVTATAYAEYNDPALAGTYVATTDVYMRNDAGKNKRALAIIPKGYKVKCFGYYSIFNGVCWYSVQAALDGVLYTGFVSSSYLRKE